MTQSFTNETKYFDLHTRGIGYLCRAREVSVTRAEPYLAVTVAALHGAAHDVEYTYIDCRVTGAEADTLIRHCKEEINSGDKVLISFTIGDIWICSGQLIPDTVLSFSSALAGASPSLN